MSLLAIDIGNSTVHCGYFTNSTLKKSFSSPTAQIKNFNFIPQQLAIEKTLVSSVVPSIDRLVKKHFGSRAHFMNHRNIPLIQIKTKTPAEVGADRLVAAFGAWEKFRAPCLVIDLGTATTLDVILKNGEYRGGLICPGFELSRDILFERTAKLPKAPIKEPPSLIGNSTITAIQAGLIHGYRSMLEGLIEKIRHEYRQPFKIIATGGHAPFLASKLKLKVDLIDPQFLLKSLEKISRYF
jgi:type III pantothenate kinase